MAGPEPTWPDVTIYEDEGASLWGLRIAIGLLVVCGIITEAAIVLSNF